MKMDIIVETNVFFITYDLDLVISIKCKMF